MPERLSCLVGMCQTMDRARAWIKALNRVRREPLSLERMADLTAWQLEVGRGSEGQGRVYSGHVEGEEIESVQLRLFQRVSAP